jgi:phytoene dehydrogenase-like protein
MPERYDVIVIGGGPNGLGIAAYLAKSGLKVCICEERLEVGGGIENTEPVAGFRIDPHATYLYGAAAPGFEQLELDKFGFRLVHYKTIGGGVTSDGKGFIIGRFNQDESIKSIKYFSEGDAIIWKTVEEELGHYEVEFLRSIYWTPPPPQGMRIEPKDYPWSQVLKRAIPGIYDEAWNEMSTFELLDTLLQSEPLKVMFGMSSWYNGPHPSWKGTGIMGLACNLLQHYSSGSPRGGMHSLAHVLARAAVAYGTRIITNCKVEKIIVVDGEARGVQLSDASSVGSRSIMADKAVISAVHVKNTFLDLIESKHLDISFIQKIKGISLKGGSLFVLSLITDTLPEYKGDFGKLVSTSGNYPSCTFMPCDSREAVINQMRDIYTLNTHSTKIDNYVIPVVTHFDETRAPKGYYVLSPIYMEVPPPEYHKDGPDAVNKAKDQIAELMIESLRRAAPNMTKNRIKGVFINTPYDSSFRNMAFVGGNWYGIREDDEQWWNLRPLPELSRYRTPIQKLYLCNHTSYPGGLALLAVPYNLMHILIDDGIVQPGSWWYPSPWYISDKEVR